MSARGLVDSHAHLMDAAFDGDRASVLQRAADAAVVAMLVVGYDMDSSRAAVDLARRHPNMRAAVGIHPNSAAQASTDDFEAIAELARDASVVAIGETGLDNFREFSPPHVQREALDWHFQLAAERDLPIVIHNRKADADIGPRLVEHARGRSSPGVLHCFSSTDPDYLERMLAAGYTISFAGPLTYKNADALRAMAARVPLDRLLVETDCPYVPPASRRGQRNEPANVRETADCLADVHQLPFAALIDRLWSNTARVFPSLVGLTSGVA